jgi:hypothetical protein
MKFALIIGCALVVATPTAAAPPWVEDYCRAQAFEANLAGRGEGEAFMARCIADFAPTRSAKRERYKKPRY